MNQLKEDCYKALHSLYIAVPSDVARDVNTKVKVYIEYLEDIIKRKYEKVI